MEKVMKGYIFRLYLNIKQKEIIEKSFGCLRYIYNYFLGKNKNYINASINIMYELIKKYMNSNLSEL